MDTATIAALKALSKKHGLTSDYQIAKRLEISRQRVSMYVNGHRRLDDDIAVRVAEDAGLPPERLLAQLAVERANDPKVRDAWARLVKLAPAASVAVAMLAAPMLAINVNRASQAYDVAEISSPALLQVTEKSVNIMSNDGRT